MCRGLEAGSDPVFPVFFFHENPACIPLFLSSLSRIPLFFPKKQQSKKRKKTHSCLIRISSAAQTYDFLNSQRTGNKSRQYRLNRSIDSYGWAGIIVELGLVPNVPKRFQKLKPFCLPGTLVCHSVDKVSRRLHTLYFVLIVVSNRLCHSLLPKSVSLQSFWNLVRPIEETKIGKMLLSFH